MNWGCLDPPGPQVLGVKSAVQLHEGGRICGYASLFGTVDQGGDVVQRGAYAGSLAKRGAAGVKMLWQHDPHAPVGVWEVVREDAKGLWVEGHLLPEVAKGREAAALIAAGAVDGLSIGYRVTRATRDTKGRRLLHEVELWEVSLVTFPMQLEARLAGKSSDIIAELQGLRRDIAQARHAFGSSSSEG